MLFKELHPNVESFKTTTWAYLKLTFATENYMTASFLTPEKIFFMISSQYNNRTLRYLPDEFGDYFNKTLIEGLPILFFKLNVWLDQTLANLITDPKTRGNIRSSVINNSIENIESPTPFAGNAVPLDASDFAAKKAKIINSGDNMDYEYSLADNIRGLFAIEYNSEWKVFLASFDPLFSQFESFHWEPSGDANHDDSKLAAEIAALTTRVVKIEGEILDIYAKLGNITPAKWRDITASYATRNWVAADMGKMLQFLFTYNGNIYFCSMVIATIDNNFIYTTAADFAIRYSNALKSLHGQYSAMYFTNIPGDTFPVPWDKTMLIIVDNESSDYTTAIPTAVSILE